MDPRIVKKTQDTLGKIIKKPPLTEKLLSKPPFRFLHDIITSVIKTTGFMNGLYKEEELNSENVKDKDSKIAFLQKAIDFTAMVTGKSLSVKPAKIVAGHEPEKTNEFLQCLAAAINKGVDNDEYVAKMTKGGGEPKEEKRDKSKEGSREDRKKRDSEDKKDRDKSASREKSRERHRDKEDRHKDREDRHRDKEDKKDRHRDKESRHKDKDDDKEDRHKDREERHREKKERRKAQDEVWKNVGVEILDSDSNTSSDIDLLEGLSQTDMTASSAIDSAGANDSKHNIKSKRPGGARHRSSRTVERTSSDDLMTKEGMKDSEQSTTGSERQIAEGKEVERKRNVGTKSRLAVRQAEEETDPHQDGATSRADVRPGERRAGKEGQTKQDAARQDQIKAQHKLKSVEQKVSEKAKKKAPAQHTQKPEKSNQDQSPTSKKSSKERKYAAKKGVEEDVSSGRSPNKRESREESPKFIPRKHSRMNFDPEYMERKIREKKRQGSMYSVQREWKMAERAMHSRTSDRGIESRSGILEEDSYVQVSIVVMLRR